MPRHVLALLICLPMLPSCSTEADDTDSVDAAWDGYEVAPPEGRVLELLAQAPFRYPEKVCVPASEIAGLPADAVLETAEDGTPMLCVWDLFSGAVPEGLEFTDVVACDGSFTQGPPWFAAPERVYESPPELLEDEAYVAELDWVQAQIEASGCGCCHASGLGSGNTAGFDASAPAVWTDTMTNARIAMAAGYFEEHRFFGRVEASDNHGFDRVTTLFPSTDPARMQAFFAAEFERRGGTDEDMAIAQGQFDALFGFLADVPDACIEPFEGIQDGRITWNGGEVRQLYVLEQDADTPAFPPNLDRPEGTVWAVYVDNDGTPIESGALAIGEVPSGARQMVPADGSAPALVDGRTYRLFGTTDIMVRRNIDCTFTYQEPE